MPTALVLTAPGRGELAELAELDACAAALAGWRLLAVTAFADQAAARGLVPLGERAGALAGAARRADALVVVGASLDELASRGARSRAAHLAPLAAAAFSPRRLALVGMEARAHPGRWGTALERMLVRRAGLLVLRDSTSADALAAIGAPGPFRVGADPVWSLLEPPTPTRATRGDTVVVVPPPLAPGHAPADGALGRLAGALQEVAGTGRDVVVQPWDGPAGVPPAPLGAFRLLPRPGSLVEAGETLTGAACVVACRLHAAIAAATAGVPVVALGADEGLGELARRLGQRVVAADAAPRAIAGEIAAAVQAPGPAVEAVKEEIARAEEGFRLLRVLLGARGGAEAESLGALPLEPSPR